MKNTLIGILLSTLTIFAPVKALLATISIFVMVDTLFALYVYIYVGEEKFKSNRLFNLAIKTFVYMGVIIMGFALDLFIFGGLFGIPHLIAKIMTLVFVYTEITSINEKSMKLGNKSIWLMIKELINKGKELKSDLSDVMDDEIKKEK